MPDLTFLNIEIPLAEPVFIIALLMVVLLVAPVVFERMRIPSIVGLLVMGAVIGENGLNLIPSGLEFTILGTIGLQYLMFLAGLEIDLIDFIENKKKSIIFGLLSYAIPFVIGWATCFYILEWDQATSMLVAAMLSSHTLISYPILGKLGIVNKQIVTVIIGGTIIADVLALLSMEIVTNFTAGSGYFSDLLQFGLSFGLFILYIFVLLPLIIKPFINHYEGNIGVLYVFILALLFISCAVAHLLNLEPILGAFFSGIVLNRFIQRDSPLFKRIEFIGNNLFIPIFLVSVGVLVNIHIVIANPTVVIATLILIAAAMTGKYAASFISRYAFNFSAPEGNMMFGLSVSRAASALAIVLVGFNLGILNEAVINHTIILILFTSIISTYITQHAGRRLAEEDTTEEEFKKIRERIMVPVANPATMGNLLDFASLIKKSNDPNPVYPLSVVVGKAQPQKIIQERYLVIDKVVKRLHSDTKFEIVTRLGLTVTDGIMNAMQELMVSFMIIGWHDKYTPLDTFFGSIFEKLLKKTDKMLFVVKTPYSFSYIKRMYVFIPEKAEGERGFGEWLEKVILLSKRLKSKVNFYASGDSLNAIMTLIKEKGTNSNIDTFDIDTFNVDKAGEKDTTESLYIFIRSRKHMLSYNKLYEKNVVTMTSQLKKNDIIYIYPEQH